MFSQQLMEHKKVSENESIKNRTYIELKNHKQKYWKHFVYSMLQRLSTQFQKQKQSQILNKQKWIKTKIDQYFFELARVSDKKAIQIEKNYKKQVKIWERTFQKMLIQANRSKKKYNEQLADLYEDYVRLKKIMKNQNVRMGNKNEENIDWISLTNMIRQELDKQKLKVKVLESELEKRQSINNFQRHEELSIFNVMNQNILVDKEKISCSSQITPLVQNKQIYVKIQSKQTQNKQKQIVDLLLRISKLQQNNFKQSQYIQELEREQQEIIERALEDIQQLNTDIDVGTKLYHKKTQELSQIHDQHTNLLQKYRTFMKQCLDLHSTPKSCLNCQEQREKISELENKIEIETENEQILTTNASELTQFNDYQSQNFERDQKEFMEVNRKKFVQKSILTKYLLEFINFQLSGQVEKKISTFETVIAIVDPSEQHQQKLRAFVQKVRGKQRVKNGYSFEDHFYKYLTEEK